MSAMRDQVAVTGLQPPESQTRLCCRAVASRMPYAIPRTWWISEPAKKLLETLGTGLETLSQQAAIFHYGALQLFASSSGTAMSAFRCRRVRMDTTACAPCSAGHVISLERCAVFPRLIESAQVSDVLVI